MKFDGKSIRPLLNGTAKFEDGSWPDRILVTDSQRILHPEKWRKSAVMTNRWRLVNGKALYDMDADPGQQRDVAGEHPQVVERLTDFYEAWWEELLPTFAVDCPIHLGHPAENPAALTCHDWIAPGSTPWNQKMIRSAAAGRQVTGYWNVHVVQDGDYEIRLRRWPQEADTAINDGLPPGSDVPGVAALRTIPGKAVKIVRASVRVGDQSAETTVGAEDKEAVFRLSLKAGTTVLEGKFFSPNDDLIGAYYAYVEKL